MRLVKIIGNSMSPQYRCGDYLLVGRYRWRKPSVGDDVVFAHGDFGPVFKRITDIIDNEISLDGLGAQSVDAAQLGKIPVDGLGHLERVIVHIQRPV